LKNDTFFKFLANLSQKRYFFQKNLFILAKIAKMAYISQKVPKMPLFCITIVF
jgi:hypothetical protein